MPFFFKLFILIFFMLSGMQGYSQMTLKGKVVDAQTNEPLKGVSFLCTDTLCRAVCTSDGNGLFEMPCRQCRHITVSSVGYQGQQIGASETFRTILLQPTALLMDAVVITAGRGEKSKRGDAPIAISVLNSKMLQEAKAISLDQVLNKVSGVNMVSLGNEQHQMSIRQPMTTKSLFLYLEDGIPVRTTGLFNHNAMIEMNMAAVKNIEVIKGPSSSLYGSEAIGGVINLTTLAPTAIPILKLSTQGNNIGYKRAELQSSLLKNKWGFTVSGYYADKRNGFMDYTDFHKGSLTARVDYQFNHQLSISNSATLTHYYSDMPGGVDSTMFASRRFSNPHSFTFRRVDALRIKSSLTQHWDHSNKTILSVVYRDNEIRQNPAYRIKDDYRKSGNVWTGRKDVAHGELNNSSFQSYAAILQHRKKFEWKDAVILAGLSADRSPSSYMADYIRITRDSVTRAYRSFQKMDSLLTDYSTNIANYAAFSSFEINLLKDLRFVASLRYDHFNFDFNNELPASSFSGSGDTLLKFNRLSPKIGMTYRIAKQAGVYANYSQGFVPPQVSELFTGVKVPKLVPSVFFNYEIGGWISLLRNRLSMDFSVYYLQGKNEIVSVRMDDGSTENKNSGKTLHKGIEAGLEAKPIRDISLRISAAFSKHQYVQFEDKGNHFDDNEMNNAPQWMHNAEIWYRPHFIQGLRIGLEWQKIGSYYMDAKNTAIYRGYDVLNFRLGYQHKAAEFWFQVMNVTDDYYATIASKSNSGFSYQLADPRNIQAGISFDFSGLFKRP